MCFWKSCHLPNQFAPIFVTMHRYYHLLQFHPLSEDKISQQLLCIFIAINICQDYILKWISKCIWGGSIDYAYFL
jgi:hypothetical protein